MVDSKTAFTFYITVTLYALSAEFSISIGSSSMYDNLILQANL